MSDEDFARQIEELISETLGDSGVEVHVVQVGGSDPHSGSHSRSSGSDDGPPMSDEEAQAIIFDEYGFEFVQDGAWYYLHHKGENIFQRVEGKPLVRFYTDDLFHPNCMAAGFAMLMIANRHQPLFAIAHKIFDDYSGWITTLHTVAWAITKEREEADEAPSDED